MRQRWEMYSNVAKAFFAYLMFTANLDIRAEYFHICQKTLLSLEFLLAEIT